MLDIDHPKGAFPLWFPLQPLNEPSVDDLKTLHGRATSGIAAVETVEDKDLVRSLVRPTNDVNCRHAASRMSAQDKAIHRQCARQSSHTSEAPQAVAYQPIDASREQCRKVIVIMPDPITARQHGESGPCPEGEIEPAARNLVGQHHSSTLLRKTVQMNNNVYRRRRKRDPIPAQEQVWLTAGMRLQHRGMAEIGLASRDAVA